MFSSKKKDKIKEKLYTVKVWFKNKPSAWGITNPDTHGKASEALKILHKKLNLQKNFVLIPSEEYPVLAEGILNKKEISCIALQENE